MTDRPLLEVRGLGRDYAERSLFGRGPVERALDEVSFTVEPGEIFGIVGESGSGKSTLARLIMALDRPSRGTVVFDGDDLFALDAAALKRRRRDIQMVFQDPYGSLDPRQRVGRIVAEPLHLVRPALDRAAARARVADMLEAVGLDPAAADRYPHQFSGGQRQRIAIARALITEPKLVVADEAVSALDLSVQAQVLNLLLDLRDRRGVSFLFVSHDLAVVDCIADRVAVMVRGRIVELGPAHDVFDAPAHPYTQRLIAAAPVLRPRVAPEPEASATAATNETRWPGRDHEGGCAYAPRCPSASDRCRAERPDLAAVGPGRAVACHDPLSEPAMPEPVLPE